MRCPAFTRPIAALVSASPVTVFGLGPVSVAVADGPPRDATGIASAAVTQPLRLDLGALQDEPPSGAAGDDWRVEFNSWIWLMGIEGDIGARGLTVDVSADFGDIIDASDSIVALSGRLEVGKGPWGVFIDGLYADMGVDDVSGPLGLADVDVTFEETLIDFGVMYRIGEWEPAGRAASNVHRTTLDIYAGGRYTDLAIELDPANVPSRSGDIDWLDPIVGAKLVLPLAERWRVRVNGDVGGFGVESDFTWSVTGVLGYDFSLFEHPASVYLGYRAIGQDFTEGSGADEFTWDLIQHGVILGFSLLF